ncbi:MAG TPA: TadE family type IV pilus minor pilin [Mycobacteriales bacterium]
MSRPRRAAPDGGMVTAEIAVALPALVALLAVALTAVDVVGGHLKCVDAAREAARGAARGDAPAVVRSLAGRSAPPGARVVLTGDDSQVNVRVQAVVRPLGGFLPAFTVDGRAVAAREPGEVGVP